MLKLITAWDSIRLLMQATLIEHGAQSGLPEEADRRRVAECFQRIAGELQADALNASSADFC